METTHWELEQLMGDRSTWSTVRNDDYEPLWFQSKEGARAYAAKNWSRPEYVRIIVVRTTYTVVE